MWNKRQSDDSKINSSYYHLYNAGINGAEIPPFSNLAEVWDKFHTWLAIAVNLNAEAVAGVPLRLYMRNPEKIERRLAKKLDWTPEHQTVDKKKWSYLSGNGYTQFQHSIRPSPRVVRKSNNFGPDMVEVTDDHPLFSVLTFDLIEKMMVHLQMTGNCYLVPVWDESTGLPSDIKTLKPRFVTITPHSPDEIQAGSPVIKEYNYNIYSAGMMIPIVWQPDDVWQIKDKEHWNSDLYGLGRCELAWKFLELYESKLQLDNASFKNLGLAAMMIALEGAGEDTLNRFKKAFTSKHAGPANAYKPLIHNGGITIDSVPIPDIFKNTSSIEEALIRSIAGSFGVPEGKLISNEPNRANAVQADYNWSKDTILTWLIKLENVFNNLLLPACGLEHDAVFAFDSPVPLDKTAELQRAQISVGGAWMTINEQRQKDGLLPREDGDVILSLLGVPIPGNQADAEDDMISNVEEGEGVPVDEGQRVQDALEDEQENN